MDAIRPIGSSTELFMTSISIGDSIQRVREAFRSNSAEMWQFYARMERDPLPENLRPLSTPLSTDSRPPVVRQLSEIMGKLSDSSDAFLRGLCEIPEFSDKQLVHALVGCRNWLKYRAKYLDSRQGKYPVNCFRRLCSVRSDYRCFTAGFSCHL